MAAPKPFQSRPAFSGNNTTRPKPANGGNRGRRLPEKENPHRINNEINVPQVRLVGDNIEESRVMSIRDAIKLADEMELDLIEISPKADPPVCRIADYSKFLYQQKKKAKELKANQTKVVLKEIRFGPQTDDHDYNFKLKHAENFIKDGAKVKAYVFFRGRSIVFKEQGEILLLRFATDLEEIAKVEAMPKLEGKKMNMILAPKNKK
ncbi:MAG: translation initiation factor IF-3 [Rikenellaceae bacterium]